MSSIAGNLAQSVAHVPLGNALKAIDFAQPAYTPLLQNQVIYATTIGARIHAASLRSGNEMRETAVRDCTGYLFWYFASDIILRAYLKKALPKSMQPALLKERPKPNGGFAELMWKLNPTARYEVPTSHQVQARHKLTLERLEQKLGKGSEAFKKAEPVVEQYFKELLQHRYAARALGIAFAIGILSVGIQALNMFLTHENVVSGKTGRLNATG
ncbi:MAG: hypothetical protein VKJ06_08455 [Vampirovibrionales bacterium]|nr:hypothetical protein [Vampirovibrionales bacterium]